MPFPVGAYPAQVPGYMNVYNGFYGAMPGGIGQGGFGCMNNNPFAMANPFMPGMMPFMGGPGLLANPYINPMMNPMMTGYAHPMLGFLNSGGGPGWGAGYSPLLMPAMPVMRGPVPPPATPFGFGPAYGNLGAQVGQYRYNLGIIQGGVAGGLGPIPAAPGPSYHLLPPAYRAPTSSLPSVPPIDQNR
jgi:hypothetical protein